MFFARKFEALIDQSPINELEENIGGLNGSTKGWNSYWLNTYNTIDQEPGSDIIKHLAKTIVSSHIETYSECNIDLLEVRK